MAEHLNLVITPEAVAVAEAAEAAVEVAVAAVAVVLQPTQAIIHSLVQDLELVWDIK